VIGRIPLNMAEFDTEVLIIDDSSQDRTFEMALEYRHQGFPFPITVLFNPVNQGYGGNQKLGFHYAIRERFDIVALVHGDGQYAPEELPRLLGPLAGDEADAVFGSRMMEPLGALHGGMPMYKYVGNRILTTVQNHILQCHLSEFHSGYRLYSVRALARIPFDRNSNDFHFDTEIIIQLLRARLRIKELPIPTYYGDEICHVNGMKYAFNVVKASLLARAQDFGIFYERKFDIPKSRTASDCIYRPKLGYTSPHTLVADRVPPEAAVLDIGCGSGYVSDALKNKGCYVTGVDCVPLQKRACVDDFILHDLDQPLPIDAKRFQYVLLLDIVEHLHSPEAFVDALRLACSGSEDIRVMVSTGNIAFIVTRFMLLLGWFNYGARGILDLTHTRLFTFSSMMHLFEQAGYRIEEVVGVPAPIPLALGNTRLAKLLLNLNKLLIKVSKTLFSYQIFMVVRPLPLVESLLQRAAEATRKRTQTPRTAAALHGAPHVS